MKVLRRRLEDEWVDREVALSKPDFQVAAFQQRREFSVAVPEIEDDRQRLVLLRVGDEEVQEEALAAAGRAEHKRMADILDMEIEGVRRLMARFKDRQRLVSKMRTDRLPSVEREEEAQIGVVRLQQRKPSKVVPP